MSASVNPPRLFVFTLPTELAGDVTLLAETEAGALHLRKQEPMPHRCSPVEAYVPEAELERLRAALESIAALQTEAPADTSEETGERFDGLRDAYECGEMDGYRDGQWEAAEMARKALVKP